MNSIPDYERELSEWEKDCLYWHETILYGKFSHWCYDWDLLPIDETMEEFDYCNCYSDSEIEKVIRGEL